ncbi:MAG TPA: DUF4845 domain-containing protein [Woeseiaceae bacterium]|nr:DUF4845 domain-containing protein [Woeseiaceae bacterium]
MHRRAQRQLRPATSPRWPAGQRGMTTLGFIILAVFVGLFAFAAIRLTPVYLNYLKVAGVVSGVKQEFDGQNPSLVAIRRSIERRFDIESVSEISARDIKVTAQSAGYEIDATYDHTAPFIANVSFTVHFSKKELVRR